MQINEDKPTNEQPSNKEVKKISLKDEIVNYEIAKNKFLVTVIYIFVQFLLASLITIGISLLMCTNKGLDQNIMFDTFKNNKDTIFPKEYMYINYTSQALGNFFGYFIVFTVIIILCRTIFAFDFKKIKDNRKFYSIFIPVSTVGFALLSYGVDKLIGNFVPSSANQSTIVNIISSGHVGLIFMSLSVLLAPIVEEFIYRHVIFYFLRRQHIVFSYITSVILFVLPHMLSSNMENIGVWFLQAIPYTFSAIMLTFIYHKSNRNIYSSICAHMLNNIIALIEVYIVIAR